MNESNPEAKARRVPREKTRTKRVKGRVKAVVPKDDDEAARKELELEKRLREIAPRG